MQGLSSDKWLASTAYMDSQDWEDGQKFPTSLTFVCSSVFRKRSNESGFNTDFQTRFAGCEKLFTSLANLYTGDLNQQSISCIGTCEPLGPKPLNGRGAAGMGFVVRMKRFPNRDAKRQGYNLGPAPQKQSVMGLYNIIGYKEI